MIEWYLKIREYVDEPVLILYKASVSFGALTPGHSLNSIERKKLRDVVKILQDAKAVSNMLIAARHPTIQIVDVLLSSTVTIFEL